jgi:serine/threonine protein kinase
VLKRSDEIALGDFRTEIAILRKISHPNCVQFLGACTKQKPYIVLTELMACSLADAFNKTFYAPTQRRQVRARGAERGLGHGHAARRV